MIRRATLALLFCCCLAGVAVAVLTFPTLTGRVVDDAALLSVSDRAGLTATLADLEAKTTDQLVVVTLKSLQGTTIEDYGYQLGRHWQIGQKDKDSGVLLIVAATERKVRIEVGYGLEGTLTDASTKLIIENTILPALEKGDFALGIRYGADQIVHLLLPAGSSSPSPSLAPVATKASGPIWPIIVVGVLGIGLLVFCAISGGGICAGIMQVLFLLALSGRGGGSGGGRSASFSGGGGSFGGGGSSGSW